MVAVLMSSLAAAAGLEAAGTAPAALEDWQFIGHFYQGNVTLYNPIIDFIQSSEVGEGDECDKDGQDPVG